MIKVVPKERRSCLEHYLDEYKVVSVIDGQNYMVVGEGEKKFVRVLLLNCHWDFAIPQGRRSRDIIYNGG